MSVQLKANVKQPQNNDEFSFNFDLERMKKAVASKKEKVPPIKSVEDLDKWLETT